MEDNFELVPRNIIKAEMKRRGICSKRMVELLNQRGETLDFKSFNNKMYRGSFNAAFFLKCLIVLKVKNIDLNFLGE